MDPDFLAGLVFVLLLVTIIGGFVLLFPITRRLGRLLEQRLQEKAPSSPVGEINQLRASIDSLRADLDKLSERQAFTELLLEERAQELPVDRQGALLLPDGPSTPV